MDKKQIETEIESILKWALADEKTCVSHELSFQELGFDSCDTLYLLTYIEKHFGISFSDDFFLSKKSVAEVCDFIEQNLQSKTPPN